MEQLTVTSSDGTRLSVHRTGKPGATPIVFVHGWGQCHLSWMRQLNSSLADDFNMIAFDLRGHGQSDAPGDAHAYTSGDQWAEDLRAIVESLDLDRPVLVGSSYGGLILCDYVRVYGSESVRALNFSAAAVHIGPDEKKFGEDFVGRLPGLLSDDLLTRIDAVRGFVGVFTASPLPQADAERVMIYNAAVPVHVKRALLSRTENFDAVLKALTVPVLVSQGDSDRIVLSTMSEHTVSVVPNATLSLYEGVGHAPFREDEDRFNRELAELASGANP